MSKTRQNLPHYTDDIPFEPLGDGNPYVIFTQLKDGAAYRLAGYLDATDHEMAIVLAKEHYGQDQPCTSIWAIPRTVVAGNSDEFPTSSDAGTMRAWQVFTQAVAGDQPVSSMTVEATCSADAVDAATSQIDGAEQLHRIWVVPADAIIATEPGEMIWRYTDQLYRMARGYSKSVREKWDAIRADRDITEYEKDDLKETF
ncbi:MAG: hypothetical protein AAF432_01225 [Planctomycetota bacterium]